MFTQFKQDGLFTQGGLFSSQPLFTQDQKKVEFVFSDGHLNGMVNFSRASAGTYLDSILALQTAAIDIPRFTYE